MRKFPRHILAIPAIFALAIGTGLLAGWGCYTPPTAGPTPANLVQVDSGILACAQPKTPEQWSYLRTRVSRDLKLNTGDEASDQGALDVGMQLFYFPIDTDSQLLPPGPSPELVSNAVAQVQVGTVVHCEHGQDRTWMILGAWYLGQGSNSLWVWQQMTNHGYHRQLYGLDEAFNSACRAKGQPEQAPHFLRQNQP
jgi:hypothetical protein